MAFPLQAGPTYSFKIITLKICKKSLASNPTNSTREGLWAKFSVAQEARTSLPPDKKIILKLFYTCLC